MRIVMAMAIPGPAYAGIEHLAVLAELLKAAAVDAPDIPVVGRQCAPVAQPFQPFPREREFRGPPTIGLVAPIHYSVHLHGGAQTRVIPIQKAPALAPRVDMPAHSVQH